MNGCDATRSRLRADCVWLAVPQPTEWQRIGDQIDAGMIFIISQQGLVAIIGRDPRYQVCGAAHTFGEANGLVRQHRPDLLLIEPFLENRDAIRWIKDLATEFPRIRILVVSRQSELTYAERALHAGASGYWMKNSSVEELMRAIETVLAGKIYASQAIASLALQRFARRGDLPQGIGLLSDRELVVLSLIAAGHGVGQVARELGVSRKTVECHCEHIKVKLGYPNAEALHRGARELLGTSDRSARNPR